MPTRLDQCKQSWRFRHDGETVLYAAMAGLFSVPPSPKDSKSDGGYLSRVCEPMDRILFELGIKLGMERKKILRILKSFRALTPYTKIRKAIDRETQNIRSNAISQSETVTLHPKALNEEAIVSAARKKILEVIIQVISFCEDGVKE